MAIDRVCIIGAGSSGIAAAKILHERGIPFDCFDGGIGGNWRYDNDNNMSNTLIRKKSSNHLSIFRLIQRVALATVMNGLSLNVSRKTYPLVMNNSGLIG